MASERVHSGYYTSGSIRRVSAFDINIDAEQDRLRAHEIILFQFPVFWYASPSLLKEWQDLVLEHGFAYGDGGDALAGKRMMLAVTAGGPETAYAASGYNHFELRTLLTPWEQTARLCKMDFLPPYVLFGSLKAPAQGRVPGHVTGFNRLLETLSADHPLPEGRELLTADDFVKEGAADG